MRRLLVPVFLVAIAAAAVLIVTYEHTTSSGGPLIVSGKLPVVACKTSRGLPRSGTPTFGDQLQSTAGIDPMRYAYYTDNARQVTPVLGPRGWRCAAVVAADGGTAFTLTPPLAARRDEPAGTMGERIHVEREPACQGCVAGLICRFLPKLAKTFDGGAYDYVKCSGKRPAHEQVSRVSGSPGSTVVRFSGRSDGILLFRQTTSGAMAALATCELPGTAHSACGPILSEFRNRSEAMY